MKRVWVSVLVAAVAGFGWVAVRAAAGEETPEPVHDAGVTEQALAIRGMFLLENHDALRPALGKLQRSVRVLRPEEKERYGAVAVDYTVAFQRAVSATRELVIDGEFEDAVVQYGWVLAACTGCHQATREAGQGPPVPVTP